MARLDTVAYIGIDPGEKSGAIAWEFPGTLAAEVAKMPESAIETIDLLRTLLTGKETPRIVVTLEEIGNFVGAGKAINSIMKVKAHCAFLRGAVQAISRMHPHANIVLQRPSPQRWQKEAQIPPRTKAESGPQFKRRMKAIAQERWPYITVLNNTADALLIMQAGRAMDLG